MKKFFYLAAIAATIVFSISSCGKEACPDHYTGDACDEQITPSKITISKIEVLQFPATDAGGAGWDLASGADILLVVEQSSNQIWVTSNMTDANPTDVNFFIPLSEIQVSPTAQCTIDLYDYDDFDPNDYMGGIVFTPYSSTGGFPATKTLSVGGITYKVYFNYEF